MAIKTIKNNREIYTIVAEDQLTRASFIPAKGGIGCSIIMPYQNETRELLFLHDFFEKEAWHDLPGGWPFLFPVCARVARNGKEGDYLYDGQLYSMPMHGFAWRYPWQVIAADQTNSLTMRFIDNENTRQFFPFAFQIELTYRVTNKKLICQQTYTNLSQQVLPYYAGFHPYFLTPAVNGGKEQVILNYEPTRRFRYNENFTDLVGEQALFTLPSPITNPELNEQLTKVGKNKKVNLIYPDGLKLQLHVEGTDDPDLFSYLQLYTMKEKPFFCIEPWMSFPNAINTVKGVRWLQPGKSDKAVLTLTIE